MLSAKGNEDRVRRAREVRITRIRATPIDIPLEAPLSRSARLYSGTSTAIGEIESDESLIGLGEAPSPDHFHDPAFRGRHRRIPLR